jgi:hypothetical protein
MQPAVTLRPIAPTLASSTGPVYASIQTASYSGATLLCFLLATHPAVASVGELDGLIPSEDPEAYRCSCGELVRACGFWRAVAAEMQVRGEPFDAARFETRFEFSGPRLARRLRAGSLGSGTANAARDHVFQSLPWERPRWRGLTRRNEALVRSIAAVTGKRVLVDSSKDGLRLAAFRDLTTVPVAAIHLVRDARGVLASRLRRGVPISATEGARQWQRLNRRVEANLSTLSAASTVRIRYEDLCADPDGALAAVHGALGVAPAPLPADFRAQPHHIVGNAMRLTDIRSITADETWRGSLTSEQIADVEAVAGATLERYGYR